MPIFVSSYFSELDFQSFFFLLELFENLVSDVIKITAFLMCTDYSSRGIPTRANDCPAHSESMLSEMAPAL